MDLLKPLIAPLAIPLIMGRATISTIVIYGEKTRHRWGHAMLAGYGAVIGLIRPFPVPGSTPAS